MIPRAKILTVAMVLGLLGAGLGGCGSPAPPQPAKELALDLGGGVKLELVLIPAGKFMMGSPESEKDRSKGERQQEVTISQAYYMGKYVVTQEQYEKVMGANPSNFKGAKNPVETVSWDDANTVRHGHLHGAIHVNPRRIIGRGPAKSADAARKAEMLRNDEVATSDDGAAVLAC